MLSLVVRTVAPEIVHVASTFPESEWVFCCRRAACLVRRLQQEPRYPHEGVACVYILHVPDDMPEHVAAHDWKCGELILHAIRFDHQVEISVAPTFMTHVLPVKPGRCLPMKVDMRYVCMAALTPELRAIVPDKRFELAQES